MDDQFEVNGRVIPPMITAGVAIVLFILQKRIEKKKERRDKEAKVLEERYKEVSRFDIFIADYDFYLETLPKSAWGQTLSKDEEKGLERIREQLDFTLHPSHKHIRPQIIGFLRNPGRKLAQEIVGLFAKATESYSSDQDSHDEKYWLKRSAKGHPFIEWLRLNQYDAVRKVLSISIIVLLLFSPVVFLGEAIPVIGNAFLKLRFYLDALSDSLQIQVVTTILGALAVIVGVIQGVTASRRTMSEIVTLARRREKHVESVRDRAIEAFVKFASTLGGMGPNQPLRNIRKNLIDLYTNFEQLTHMLRPNTGMKTRPQQTLINDIMFTISQMKSRVDDDVARQCPKAVEWIKHLSFTTDGVANFKAEEIAEMLLLVDSALVQIEAS